MRPIGFPCISGVKFATYSPPQTNKQLRVSLGHCLCEGVYLIPIRSKVTLKAEARTTL
jgi:hypothetical protein